MTWRPISTAPRDGTYVLLANSRCKVEPFDRYIGAFRERLHGEPGDDSMEWRDYAGRYSKPTHWMPLPSAVPEE